jgi:hypothetical protein
MGRSAHAKPPRLRTWSNECGPARCVLVTAIAPCKTDFRSKTRCSDSKLGAAELHLVMPRFSMLEQGSFLLYVPVTRKVILKVRKSAHILSSLFSSRAPSACLKVSLKICEFHVKKGTHISMVPSKLPESWHYFLPKYLNT